MESPSRRSVSPASARDSNYEQFANDFNMVTTRLAQFRGSGRRIAVIDEAETMFQLAAGLPPSDRYLPLFIPILTRPQLEGAKARFLANRFDVVMIRGRDASSIYRGSIFDAHMDGFRDLIAEHFVLTERIGPYGLWFSRPLTSPGLRRNSASDDPSSGAIR